MNKNVIDEYKDLEVEEIRKQTRAKSNGAAVAMHNVKGDLNLGSIVRTANFLGFSEVIYFGRKKYDRRGAVGTYHYTDVIYCPTEDEFLERVAKYTLVALENNIDCETSNLWSFTWPDNPCILVGEEQNGLPISVVEACKYAVEIPGNGSVKCLNVSVAAAIAMSHYEGIK